MIATCVPASGWRHQAPFFDIAGWVLSLAGLSPGLRVLVVVSGDLAAFVCR